MALTTCRECRREVSTSAATCPHCGVPSPGQRPSAVNAQSSPNRKGCLLLFGGLVTFGIVMNIYQSCADEGARLDGLAAQTQQRATDSAEAVRLAALPGPLTRANAISYDAKVHAQPATVPHASLHLAAATARLDSAEVLIRAKAPLPAIQAQLTALGDSLPAALLRRNEALHEAIAPRLAAEKRQREDAVAAGKEALRRKFASSYESSLLDQGIDATVTVSGRHATTLRLKWILVNRVLAHQFSQKADLFTNLRNMGFTRLEITDGYDASWYWNF